MIRTMHDPFRSAPDNRIVKGLDGDFGADAELLRELHIPIRLPLVSANL